MNRWIDLSWPVREIMPVFPGDAAPHRAWDAHPDHGDTDEVSRWTLGAHTGTHVDAPRHFVAGAGDIEAIGLTPLIGPARVLDLAEVAGHIDAHALAGQLDGADRVLLRTRNSMSLVRQDQFDAGYVALTTDGARAIVDAGVRTVGVDYLSVDQYPSDKDFDFPAHRTLLGAEVVIIEGLDLHDAPVGEHFLCCLPIRLSDAEASPARALLFLNNATDQP